MHPKTRHPPPAFSTPYATASSGLAAVHVAWRPVVIRLGRFVDLALTGYGFVANLLTLVCRYGGSYRIGRILSAATNHFTTEFKLQVLIRFTSSLHNARGMVASLTRASLCVHRVSAEQIRGMNPIGSPCRLIRRVPKLDILLVCVPADATDLNWKG